MQCIIHLLLLTILCCHKCFSVFLNYFKCIYIFRMSTKEVIKNLDCALFFESVIQSLKPVFELRVGLSFFMTNQNKYSYVHSVVAKPINTTTVIRSHTEATKLIQYFKGFSYSEFLDLAFRSRNEVNPFEKSGYTPRKLVCITAWITKGELPKE